MPPHELPRLLERTAQRVARLLTELARACIVLGAVLLGANCASTGGSTCTIRISGTEGAQVTGFFVRQGHRVGLTNTVPFTVTETGLSKFEVRKVRREDALGLRADGAGLAVESSAPPGVPGLTVFFNHGVQVSTLQD